MGKLFIFIFLLLVPVTLLSTEEIKCFEEKDNQDSTLKHVTVTFKGQKYTRTIKNETKFVSCEVKVAGENSFVFYIHRVLFCCECELLCAGCCGFDCLHFSL